MDRIEQYANLTLDSKRLPLCIPVDWIAPNGDVMLAYPRLLDPRRYSVVNCSDARRLCAGEHDYLAVVDDYGALVRVRESPLAGAARALNCSTQRSAPAEVAQ